MPKATSHLSIRVRYSDPLSPWRRCKYPSCNARLRTSDELQRHEQEHHHTYDSLERSVDHLERSLRELSVLDSVPEQRRRPKKRVRFCSPSRSVSSSTSSTPSSADSSPSSEVKPLPTILLERTATSWRAVPANSSRYAGSPPPPTVYATGQDGSSLRSIFDNGASGLPTSALVQTLELQGEEWKIISARSIADINPTQ